MEKLQTLWPQRKKNLLMCVITGKARGSTVAHLYSMTSKILHRKRKITIYSFAFAEENLLLQMPKPKKFSLRKITALLNKAAWFKESFMSAQVKLQSLMHKFGVFYKSTTLRTTIMTSLSHLIRFYYCRDGSKRRLLLEIFFQRKRPVRRDLINVSNCVCNQMSEISIWTHTNDWKIKMPPKGLSCCFTFSTPRYCQ